MKDYVELKALIEKCGVHPQLGPVGDGMNVEQNPHELATFLVRMQELGVSSVLEIGTGYKAGLARFLAHEMGWQVTTVDVQDYGHTFEGIEFITPNNPHYQTDRRGLLRSWDLVFIDADHSYNMVKLDYDLNKDFATKAIAFHDIAGLRDCEGARDFWIYVMGCNPVEQIRQEIDDSDQRAGIGWIEL